MNRLLASWGMAVGFCTVLAVSAGAVEVLRVNGSAAATAPLVAASAALQAQGLVLQIDSGGSSSSAVEQVGEEQVDLGVTVRPLTKVERVESPRAQLTQTLIGQQIVVPVVTRELWEAGVRSLTAAQARQIYEGRVQNWRQLGGPDLPLHFYNPAQGRGVWEIAVGWLYGDLRRAPLGEDHDPVDGKEQTREALASDPGACSYAFASWAQRRLMFPLSVRLDDGTLLEGTLENALTKGYPLTRPLYFITPARPFGATLRLITLFRGEIGQQALAESEFLPAE